MAGISSIIFVLVFFVIALVGSCIRMQVMIEKQDAKQEELAHMENGQQANPGNATSLNPQAAYAAPAYPPPAYSTAVAEDSAVIAMAPTAATPAAATTTPAASTSDIMRILIATERERDPAGTFGKTDDEVAVDLLARR
ncbi:hypothetical protein BC831DRAFT_458694 [Entophlyctis helioformis]|nr:hypothetical protein BC831DRAFT_458694 [Entophlyctis helioformis]